MRIASTSKNESGMSIRLIAESSSVRSKFWSPSVFSASCKTFSPACLSKVFLNLQQTYENVEFPKLKSHKFFEERYPSEWLVSLTNKSHPVVMSSIVPFVGTVSYRIPRRCEKLKILLHSYSISRSETQKNNPSIPEAHLIIFEPNYKLVHFWSDFVYKALLSCQSVHFQMAHIFPQQPEIIWKCISKQRGYKGKEINT